MMPAMVEGAAEHDGARAEDSAKGAVALKTKSEKAKEHGTTSDKETALVEATAKLSIAPLPHITHGFQSLGNIMARLVQDSYGKLVEVAESLHEGNEVARKKKLMNFMTETRSQFIKVLVLTQWAKNAEEVSRVIDLKAWLDEQRMLYDKVVWDLFEVRRNLVNAKIPNPDIKTAVQILTTGEASKTVPHRHYVPPKPLSSAEILKALQEMNTLLSIRFALHDIPPQHFNNYRIRDGRATFSVPTEFEVDLSIANDDPTSQLYIVDFRLLFKPSLDELPTGRLRTEIEYRGNEILRTKGLAALYDFLHEFVMTHKISILKRQAVEMGMGKWTETLFVTMIKRTLVVQYWMGKTGAQGAKSWVEIGIRRGDSRSLSHLDVKWMRDAKEVKNANIPFDTETLSTESLLKGVIALHTAHILSSIRENLSTLPIFPSTHLKLHISSSKATISNLCVQITPSRILKILIEPITGRFALQPPSSKVIAGETLLNQTPDPARKGHETIMRIRFTAIQDEIDARAVSMGWDVLRMLNVRFTDLKKWFGSSAMYLMYMRKKSWAENWIVVVSLGVGGDFWWVAEIKEAVKGWTIPDAQKIPITGPQNVTYQFLENLEKMVASFITLYTNTRRLNNKRIAYKLLPTQNPNASVVIPSLNINFKSLTKADWGYNNLRLSVHDLDKNGNIDILVEGRMKIPVTGLQAADLSATNDDLAFSPRSGVFVLRFNLPVGSIVTSTIVERLKRIERLITFISTVQKYNLPARHVSLGQISFVYLKQPELSATVDFSGEKKMHLSFDARGSNPHRRILQYLNVLLNEKGLEAVVCTLRLTLPLLVALDVIEEASGEDQLFVIARSSEWYRLEYASKGYVVDIKLRMRRNTPWWFIRDANARLVQGHPPESAGLGTAGAEHQVIVPMRQLCVASEDNIEGLKTGVAASMDTVGRVIRWLHRLASQQQGFRGPPPTAPS